MPTGDCTNIAEYHCLHPIQPFKQETIEIIRITELLVWRKRPKQIECTGKIL